MKQWWAKRRLVAGRLKPYWQKLKTEFLDYPILASLGLVFACLSLVVLLSSTWPRLREGFWPGVFVEFNGMIFDILVFGVLIAFYTRRSERRHEIQRQQETIADCKKLDTDEAKARIAGAVRRLNKLGKTDIDFGGIEVSGFFFPYEDIKSIRGSVFYDGTWGEMGSRDRLRLHTVSFAYVDCRDVIFSKFNPFKGLDIGITAALFENCDFREARLDGAVFNGPTLEWSHDHPENLGVWHEGQDSGPTFEQTHFPAFSNVDLAKTSFKNAKFENADFRDTRNILSCDFEGAQGLETCLFDTELIKDAVMANAAG